MSPTQHGGQQDPADADAPVIVAEGPAADEAAAEETPIAGAPPELIANSVGEYARIWLKRVRNGESGALPVILGLIAIIIFFQVKNSLFLSAGNLVNLLVQGAPFVLLGMAEVFVLLLGEIDLSVGFNAGIGAVVTLWAVYTLPWWVAIILGLAATAFIGFVQGSLITRLGLPSFVVTLAGLLGLEGLLIILVARTGHGAGGSIGNPSNIIYDLAAGNLSPVAGWIVMVVVVGLAGLFMILRDRRRRANGLVAPPISVTLLKVAVMAVAGVVVVVIGNTDRGVGLVTRARGSLGGPHRARRSCAVDRPDQPDPLRAVYLRDRRQRGGGQEGGRQPDHDTDGGLRAVRPDGRNRRNRPRLEAGLHRYRP